MLSPPPRDFIRTAALPQAAELSGISDASGAAWLTPSAPHPFDIPPVFRSPSQFWITNRLICPTRDTQGQTESALLILLERYPPCQRNFPTFSFFYRDRLPSAR